MITKSRPPRAALAAVLAAACVLPLALAVAAPPLGAQEEPAARQEPAVEIDVEVEGADGTEVLEQQDVRVRVGLRRAGTGERVVGVRAPLAWIDRRAGPGQTSPEVCRDKVSRYLQGKLYTGGSMRPHADVDLNSFFVLTLNRTPDIAVLNPIVGFNGMRMHTTVRLDAPGEDWVLSPDGRRLFVSMPRAGRVAVVSTDTWRVEARLDAGPEPGRVVFGPGGALLWITRGGDTPGVAVVDAATLQVRASFPTGAGPHAVAFTPDGRLAFVASRGAGTVSVIDAGRLEKVKEVATGAAPVDLAYSPADGAVYVAHAGDGTVAVLDAATLERTARIQLDPGLHAIRFAPAAGAGHAAHGEGAEQGAPPEHAEHGGHAGHGDAAPGPERLAFVLNPRTNRLHVLDAAARELVRTDSVGHAPFQVAFTDGFAFIRSAASPEVSIVPLVDPTMGGVGPRFTFQAGEAAPPAELPPPAAGLASSPDMHDAVFAVNTAERKIYYYHYMVSMQMAMPSGSLSTFTFEPRAVLAVPKGLREEEPGVFSATVRLPEAGDYDVVVLVDSPRVVRCVGAVTVAADPRLHEGEVRLAVEPLPGPRELRSGENVLRFRLTDELSGRELADLPGLTLVVSSPEAGQVRAAPRAAEGGVYEFAVRVDPASAYYLSFEVPSVRLSPEGRARLIYLPPEAAGGT